MISAVFVILHLMCLIIILTGCIHTTSNLIFILLNLLLSLLLLLWRPKNVVQYLISYFKNPFNSITALIVYIFISILNYAGDSRLEYIELNTYYQHLPHTFDQSRTIKVLISILNLLIFNVNLKILSSIDSGIITNKLQYSLRKMFLFCFLFIIISEVFIELTQTHQFYNLFSQDKQTLLRKGLSFYIYENNGLYVLITLFIINFYFFEKKKYRFFSPK